MTQRRPADEDEQARREQYWGPAVTRLCAALGRPLPEPMTPAEEADFERQQDAADVGAARRYGLAFPDAA
jgi:hypothetical protein